MTEDSDEAVTPLRRIEPDRAVPYRVGRHNPRNIYRTNTGSHEHQDDWQIGVMFTPEDGVATAAALNLAHDLGLLSRMEGNS